MKKGVLITLYGINNIGKSTHAKILTRKIKKAGYEAKYLKYPIYDISPTGPFINAVLRGKGEQKISEDELQLWFVLNRYQYQPKILKLLEAGVIVVAEDYTGTGITWGAAKGLDREWLESANQHLLKEDFALMMEGQRDRSAKEDVHIHEQNEELIEKCIIEHEISARKYGWRKVPLQEEVVDTAKLIWNEVDDFLQERYS
ncbi:hypothetical protein KJ632_02185 [Patescibacteria group bacterium]|nr:hypothetical protein [Patescibacteria group bacterium]